MFGLDGGRRMFDRETSKPKRVSETLGRLVNYFKPYWPVLLLTLAQPELTPAQVASLTVGQRNSRLLTLREKTLGPTLQGFVNCSQCHTPLEFSAEVSAIRDRLGAGRCLTVTATRPSRMRSSALRREATPLRLRSLLRRTSIKNGSSSRR